MEHMKISFSKKHHNDKNRQKSLRAAGCRKRVSLSASMTVEASVALSLFIFFFVNILTLFDIMRAQSSIEAALHQAGNKAAYEAFYGDKADEYIPVGIVKSVPALILASDRVREQLKSIENGYSCISGGISGISFLRSKIMVTNDNVDLIASYKVQPMIKTIGFSEFNVETRYFGHAWTGYEIGSADFTEKAENEQMVYVTENGTVYHTDINCSYLKPSIKTVAASDVGNYRSSSGGKYYPCEICGGHKDSGTVYITDYGCRYHSDTNCSGLKRTIYTVPISEVGGKPPCSKCGY